jgi:lactoylglutathione lyase
MYDIAHIGVVVKDAERSKNFYCGVLGCEVIETHTDERLKAVFLRAGNGTLELLQYSEQENTVRGAGVADHIAFRVSDIESTIEVLKENGIVLLFSEPRVVMGGTKKIMFFLGPDGERLELVQDLK